MSRIFRKTHGLALYTTPLQNDRLQLTFDVITMNAPLPASLLNAIEMAPRDPILGITEAFNADKNPNIKTNPRIFVISTLQ